MERKVVKMKPSIVTMSRDPFTLNRVAFDDIRGSFNLNDAWVTLLVPRVTLIETPLTHIRTVV